MPIFARDVENFLSSKTIFPTLSTIIYKVHKNLNKYLLNPTIYRGGGIGI